MTEAQERIVKYKNLVKDVEEFITYFDGTQDNFLYGNCYWFATILKARFQNFYPDVDIVYNQIDNHFAVMIAPDSIVAFLFDASGYIGRYWEDGYDNSHWQRWDTYRTIEPLDAARVYRDCVWHMSEEEWERLPLKIKEKPWIYI